MKRIRYAGALFAALFLFVGLPASPGAEKGANAVLSPAPSTLPGANPLIEEMLTLDSAFRDIVSAVALGDTEKVRKALASLHGAMEKTHEGIHEGIVTLPKNSARNSEFVERDRRFHEMLESLDRAAGRDHKPEMLRITKLLLDGCVQCHARFRK
jgi:cytochrome c556